MPKKQVCSKTYCTFAADAEWETAFQLAFSHHRSSALIGFPFSHKHTLIFKIPPSSQQGRDLWSGKKWQQWNGPPPQFFLLLCFPVLSSPPALLVIHSWTILWGSYVNAWVCFWLEGTKSTLYKCTLKQLPRLPTGAPTQTSDWAAVWPACSGGRVGCGPFTTMRPSSWHTDFETVNKITNWR